MECSVLKRCQYRKNVQKKTEGDLPSVLGIEYTLSKTVLGKSAVISENQTATSDGERGMPFISALLSLSVYLINLKCRNSTHQMRLQVLDQP